MTGENRQLFQGTLLAWDEGHVFFLEMEREHFNVTSPWLGKSRQSPKTDCSATRQPPQGTSLVLSPKDKMWMPGGQSHRYLLQGLSSKGTASCLREKALNFPRQAEQDPQIDHKHWVPSRSRGSRPLDGWPGQTPRRPPELPWLCGWGLEMSLVRGNSRPKREESRDSSKI